VAGNEGTISVGFRESFASVEMQTQRGRMGLELSYRRGYGHGGRFVLIPGATHLSEDGGMKGMGFPTLTVEGPRHFHNRFPLDKALSSDLAKRLDVPLKRFLTRDLVCETPAEARALAKKWEADLENMEGAAFAQACLWLGIQGAELRAVSNLAGIRDKTQWRVRLAVEALEARVLELIR